jgi:hypothetical protein
MQQQTAECSRRSSRGVGGRRAVQQQLGMVLLLLPRMGTVMAMMMLPVAQGIGKGREIRSSSSSSSMSRAVSGG